MGPSNVALVKFFRADQAWREALSRLESTTKNVRAQERKVAELTARLNATQAKLKEQQSAAANSELEIKTQDAKIEKLREQQQQARNNREYQAFLAEINTLKVDKTKAEEQLLKTMEQVETVGKEQAELLAQIAAETSKRDTLRAQIGDKTKEQQAECDALKPARDELAKTIPAKIISIFERLAERFDGESMAAITRPDKRVEEYSCGGCNMDLVPDVYNKLHSRDDMVTCKSCGRILYIPEELPPSAAIKKNAGTRTVFTRSDGGSVNSKWASFVSQAQGESVRAAMEADHSPVECIVHINGEEVGLFKGKTVDHLKRVIDFLLGESKMTADVVVTKRDHDQTAAIAAAAAEAEAKNQSPATA